MFAGELDGRLWFCTNNRKETWGRIIVPESFRRLIRSKRIFQNGSESLPTLLSVITLVGRKFVAHLHPAGAFTPDQECTY